MRSAFTLQNGFNMKINKRRNELLILVTLHRFYLYSEISATSPNLHCLIDKCSCEQHLFSICLVLRIAQAEDRTLPGAMYPIDPHNIFAVEFPMFSRGEFAPPAINNLAIPKSETKAVISSLSRTLLGYRSQCITLTGEW